MLKISAIVVSVSLLATFICSQEARGADLSIKKSALKPFARSNDNKTKSEKNSPAESLSAVQKALFFRGEIEENSFGMKLTREGEKLSGTCFYTKNGKDLNVNGAIDADGNFKLTETDRSGKPTGNWEGVWTENTAETGIELRGYWFLPSQTKDEGVSFFAFEEDIDFTGGVKFVDKIVNETNDAKRSELKSVYPQIAGVDTPAAKNFNALIKKEFFAINADFRKMLTEFTGDDTDALPEGVSISSKTEYGVAFATNDLVSLVLTTYDYTGGAHGSTTFRSFNYDLKRNRRLQLADLFTPNSNYLKTISAISIANLKEEEGESADEAWIESGAAPLAKNFQCWNLTKKGLEITFNEYQVAPYVAGAKTVTIPYDKLKTILRKDGAAASLIK